MSTERTSFEQQFERLWPGRRVVAVAAVLLGMQAYLVLTYVSITNRQGGVDLFVVVPWIWINVALWVAYRIEPPTVADRDRLISGLIAGGYFFLLLVVSGAIGLGTAFSDAVPPTGFRLVLFEAPPGWTPTLMYAGDYVRLALRPPLLLGYAAIAYLLYATVTEAGRALVGSVVGLFSCVGCMVPIVVSMIGAFTGGTVGYLQPGNVAAISGYDISTAVYLGTITILWLGYRSATDDAG